MQSRRIAFLELHQDIDIALVGGVVAQDGAEQRQSLDPVSPAEFGDLFLWNVDPGTGH